jgi:alpha-D-xyloside xylohydrolase
MWRHRQNPILKRTLICIVTFIEISYSSSLNAETVTSFSREPDGVLCRMTGGTASYLKVQVCAANILRIVYTSRTPIPAPHGLIVVNDSFESGAWEATDNGSAIVIMTEKIKATVNKANGSISFFDASGALRCSEIPGGRTLASVTRGGQAGVSGALKFDSPPEEAVYGLGNLSLASTAWPTGTIYWEQFPPDRKGVLDIRGFDIDMHQANFYDVIPFFMTTRGYGILMNFCCHAVKTPPLNFNADFLLNESWDYFFVYGPEFDTIIAGYRRLSGSTPMLPKWAFGYWQSKNRYTNATELIGVVDTFRSRNIPIDCIVQDWYWWARSPGGDPGGDPKGRGSFIWDPLRYPDPKGMFKTIRDKNCHSALSIWPTFASGTSAFDELQPYLLTGVNCTGNCMNVFDTTALRIYWKFAYESCYSKGMDAWWTDATEPECELLTGLPTSSGVIDQYANAYNLALSKDLYERQRSVSATKRVVNLTRSFYGGSQRYGTIYSNGDVSSSDMKNLATSIAGGLNSCMAGNPYWCSDIGGWSAASELTDETLVRWFQAGTFFPIFRTHGTRPTEIYNFSPSVQKTCLEFSALRYRLMPYIYSLAWKVTSEQYTMTRALAFDFPGEVHVFNIADQFMFGPAFLINPVVTPGALSRSVYLPKSLWYDFWTGDSVRGTTTISEVAAPLNTIPLYCRAGSIVPLGPDIQYATQSIDPIELRVYPGADGSFILYEDENDGYAYEHSAHASIPLTWNNGSQTLTIGTRNGAFPGMLSTRTFNIVVVKGNHGIGRSVTAVPDASIRYTGTTVGIQDGRIVFMGGQPRFGLERNSTEAISVSLGIPHFLRIKFNVPMLAKGKRVTISLFNLKGATVLTPFDHTAAAGPHVIVIDPRKHMKPGRYLCRITGPGINNTVAFIVTN